MNQRIFKSDVCFVFNLYDFRMVGKRTNSLSLAKEVDREVFLKLKLNSSEGSTRTEINFPYDKNFSKQLLH